MGAQNLSHARDKTKNTLLQNVRSLDYLRWSLGLAKPTNFSKERYIETGDPYQKCLRISQRWRRTYMCNWFYHWSFKLTRIWHLKIKNSFDSLTLGEYLPVLSIPTLCCDVINNDRKKDLNKNSRASSFNCKIWFVVLRAGVEWKSNLSKLDFQNF